MIKSTAKTLLRTGHALLRDTWAMAAHALDDRIPTRPSVLQFPINDICNSRCIMCNIWRNKRRHELTPEELADILRDPLFSEIRYVGLNGGEPTLRRDIGELARTLTAGLPKLQEAGIITNSLNSRQVSERLVELQRAFAEGGVRFSVTLSIDGIGEIHDAVRGRKGNWEHVQNVVEVLRREGIRFNVGATLTPLNVYWADDILDWAREQGVGIALKPASVIARLGNEDYGENYTFTPEQLFHMVMFFDRMARDPRGFVNVRATYASMRDQIALGAPRRMGCYWRTNQGVTLDSHGGISYCSVASPVLGSALERGAAELFHGNTEVRERIKRERCADCHHLPGPIGLEDAAELRTEPLRQKLERRLRPLRHRMLARRPVQWSRALRPPSGWRRALIIGWWGSETAGDKAILGELLYQLRTHAPACRPSISTLNEIVTRQTGRELHVEFERHIPLERCGRAPVLEDFDAVLIGGGPLMDIEPLVHLREAFRVGARLGLARVIFGCGMGPLKSPDYRAMAEDICRLATAGFFRDAESLAATRDLDCRADLRAACDPALAFVAREAAVWQADGAQERPLVTLLRANTIEFAGDGDGGVLTERNHATARLLGDALQCLAGSMSSHVELQAMHALGLGGDDRLYSRSIVQAAGAPELLHPERAYLRLGELLERIGQARVAIAMRYHAHLFCLAMGVPFVSIDYTALEGKVGRLVRRLDGAVPSMAWDGLSKEALVEAVREVDRSRGERSRQLLAKRDELLACFDEAANLTFAEAAPCASS